MAINMGYCRFENTAIALEECLEALDETDGDIGSLSETDWELAQDNEE